MARIDPIGPIVGLASLRVIRYLSFVFGTAAEQALAANAIEY